MANFTNYYDPKNILCPKDYVHDVIVLYDGTANNAEDYSLALLQWDEEWTIGVRWNRSMREESVPDKISGSKICMGVPISFSYPVWFIIPRDLQRIILNNLPATWHINQQARRIIEQLKNE